MFPELLEAGKLFLCLPTGEVLKHGHTEQWMLQPLIRSSLLSLRQGTSSTTGGLHRKLLTKGNVSKGSLSVRSAHGWIGGALSSRPAMQRGKGCRTG